MQASKVTKTAAADVNLEPKPADLKPAVSAVNDEVASYMNNTVHAHRESSACCCGFVVV